MWSLLLAASASAWTLRTTDDGDPVQWQEFPVTWSRAPGTEPLPAGGDEAIVAGFDRWKGSDREVDFELGERPDGVPHAAPDYRNNVWMLGRWPFRGNDALAMSSVWVDPGGSIVTFDVRLNGEAPWATNGSPDAWDLQAAITHEVGHVLGLEHSEFEEAVMWHTASAGDTSRRELSDDDEEAVRLLYPLDPDGAGCAVVAPGGGAWALLLILVHVPRRRPGSREDR